MRDRLIDILRLLSKAIERVTVNTYVEQGALGADEVFGILAEIERMLKEAEE